MGSGGIGGLRLSSSHIDLGINLARGANIYSVVTPNEPAGWLFHDPARAAHEGPDARSYDDVWCGGFEELFPNDAPGTFEGRALRDHGELWDAPFEVLNHSPQHIQLRRHCSTVPAIVSKAVRLHAEGPGFDVAYRIEHTGEGPFQFLFKLHPALRLELGDRLLLPGGVVTPVDLSFSDIIDGPGKWPVGPAVGGGTADLSIVPGPDTRLKEFVYVSELPEGWCGLRRARTGEAIMFRYPLKALPFCWLFLTYGGWRQYYTAVLEPCTNMPKDLASAAAAGRCARLEPGGVLEFTVSIVVTGGIA